MKAEVVQSYAAEIAGILAQVDSQSSIDERLSPILDGLQNAPVRVAVVGAFKAGKSTLTNALLGEQLMPVKPVPASATIAEVSRGLPARFELELAEARTAVDRTQFQAAVERTAAKGEPVSVARAFLATSVLPEGIILADTPGVGSFEETHAEVTYGYLPTVDAVLLVIDGHQGGVQAEQLTFIRDRILQRVRDRIWVIANKLNQKPAAERPEILAEITSALRDGAGVVVPRIFAVDAKAALEARLAGQSVAGTGLDVLEAALRSEVYEKLRQVRADRAGRQLGAVIDDASAQQRTRASAMSFDAAKLDESLAKIRSERDVVANKMRNVRQDLEDDRRRFLREVELKVTAAVASIAANAGSYMQQASASPDKGELVMANAIRGDLMRAIERLTQEWLEPELRARIQNIGGSMQGALTSMTQSMPTLMLDGIRLGPNPVIMAVTEVGLVALLDFVLPGGFIVALLARGLGRDSFKPVVHEVAGWIEKLIHGVVKNTLAKQIGDQINSCAASTAAVVVLAADKAFSDALKAIEKEIQSNVDAFEAALADARTARAKGEQVASDERERLLRVVRDLEAVGVRLRQA